MIYVIRIRHANIIQKINRILEAQNIEYNELIKGIIRT